MRIHGSRGLWRDVLVRHRIDTLATRIVRAYVQQAWRLANPERRGTLGALTGDFLDQAWWLAYSWTTPASRMFRRPRPGRWEQALLDVVGNDWAGRLGRNRLDSIIMAIVTHFDVRNGRTCMAPHDQPVEISGGLRLAAAMSLRCAGNVRSMDHGVWKYAAMNGLVGVGPSFSRRAGDQGIL